jgi:hypothetical protein
MRSATKSTHDRPPRSATKSTHDRPPRSAANRRGAERPHSHAIKPSTKPTHGLALASRDWTLTAPPARRFNSDVAESSHLRTHLPQGSFRKKRRHAALRSHELPIEPCSEARTLCTTQLEREVLGRSRPATQRTGSGGSVSATASAATLPSRHGLERLTTLRSVKCDDSSRFAVANSRPKSCSAARALCTAQ